MGWKMKGEYIKNCNCIASCTCDADGRPSPHANCEGLSAMHVTEGNFDGVDLRGTKWAVAVWWPGPVFEGNGVGEVFIDQAASKEQRNALLQILSGQAGGTFFEIIKSVVPTIHGPHFVKIDFEFDYKKRTAYVKAGQTLETRTAPILWPPDNIENHVEVKMPNGFEYKVMQVAHAKLLRSSGEVKFEHADTSSSIALVEHTDKGLVA